MCSTINRETLTECSLLFGITCLSVGMCPAVLGAINSITSQQSGTLLRCTRTVVTVNTAYLPAE